MNKLLKKRKRKKRNQQNKIVSLLSVELKRKNKYNKCTVSYSMDR